MGDSFSHSHQFQNASHLLMLSRQFFTNNVDVCVLPAAGGWMRKGLGTVVSVEGKVTWTFTAPHLGYWIAAPLSSTRGKRSP